VIGLLVTPLHGKEIEFKEVKAELRDAFESRLQLDLRRRVTEAEKKNARRMQRFPTVALILRDQDGAHPGMVASFTVLGASKGLGKRKNGIAEALV